MTRFYFLFKRELQGYFYSMGYYALMAVFMGVFGWMFQAALSVNNSDMSRALFHMQSFLKIMAILVAPLLTMRTFAEEKRSGSLELLMTAPVRDLEVVLSKYFGSLVVFVSFLLPLWSCFLLLALAFDSSPDWGLVLSVSLGFIGIGSIMLALGVMCSALTSAQLWAALLAFIGALSLTFFGSLRFFLDQDGLMRKIITYVSIDLQLQKSTIGIFDFRYLLVQISMVVLFLFWTVRIVEARRWN